MKAIRTAKWGYIITSFMFGILGILPMAYPEMPKTTLCLSIGAVLVIYGMIKIIGFFSKDLYRLAFQFDLALGLLFVATGIVMLANSGVIIVFMNYAIGFILFTDGLFKLQIAIDAKRFGLNKWWIILVILVFVCAMGLYLIVHPLEETFFIMTLLGITLLLEGILNMCVAVYTVKVTNIKKTDSNDF